MWEYAPLTSHPVHQKDPRIGELSAVGDPPLSFIGKTRHFFFDFCFFFNVISLYNCREC